MRKGFTLVELSIVLVIVGLLIGGILIGKSLIESSKITAQAVQIQQFDAAVIAFKAKYRYLPADAPARGGNGDGVISNTTVINTYCNDHFFFWNQLDPSKYSLPNVSVCSGASKIIAGTHVPAAKMGSKGSFFYVTANSVDGGYTLYTPALNYYVMMHGDQLKDGTSRYINTNPANGTYYPSAATPAELAALDQKLDDGLANSGSVISGGIRMWANPTMGGACTNASIATCSVGSKYTLTNSDYTCTPMIQVGG